MPKTLLSTKKLTDAQRARLSDFTLLECPLIAVKTRKNPLPNKRWNCAVFSSQNAVKAVFQEQKIPATRFGVVFCVGSKTASLLGRFGIEVAAFFDSSARLADYLIKRNHCQNIAFFCGDLRRDELPDSLRKHHIKLEEIIVYTTQFLPLKSDQNPDAVLFFSPSAVNSYIASSHAFGSDVFCIGDTTAAAAISVFEKVHVSNTPTVEAVIDQARNFFLEDIKKHKLHRTSKHNS